MMDSGVFSGSWMPMINMRLVLGSKAAVSVVSSLGGLNSGPVAVSGYLISFGTTIKLMELGGAEDMRLWLITSIWISNILNRDGVDSISLVWKRISPNLISGPFSALGLG